MAQEKERAQYEEDCNNYVQAWELWEKRQDGRNWTPCLDQPTWNGWSEYRRKEPAFEHEYFSGLNWWEAHGRGLVGKVVEFSDDGEDFQTKRRLLCLNEDKGDSERFCDDREASWIYIRTCPETYQDRHPTITIAGGWKLPRPEVEAPENRTKYWTWTVTGGVQRIIWTSNDHDAAWLKMRIIHLTEPRAQAWADWWVDTVIKAVNK